MKHCLASIFLVILIKTSLLYANTITVTLTDLPKKTQVHLALYNSKETFLKTPFKTLSINTTETQSMTLKALPEGPYAYLIYIDQNKNNTLDRSFIGIPTEPIQLSNNYQPQGKPSFKKASFYLSSNTPYTNTHAFPKTKKSSTAVIGIGLVVLQSSSPYHGSDSGITQIFPSIVYMGKRLQVFGPMINYGIKKWPQTRLTGTLAMRFSAYKKEDSPIFSDLPDRKTAIMTGLRVSRTLNTHTLSTGWQHDISGTHSGHIVSLSWQTNQQWKAVTISPQLGLQWLSESLVNYDYGTQDSYKAPATVVPKLGCTLRLPLTKTWSLQSMLTLHSLPKAITQSPLVATNSKVMTMLALNRLL